MTGAPGVRVPDANIACVAGADATISARLWRLTRVQLENSLRSAYHALVPRVDEPLKGLVVPFGTSNSADRFSTRARSYGLDEPSFRDLMNAAGATARSLVTDLGPEACVGASDFSGCVSGLVAKAGQLFFRRPLTSQEVLQYSQIAASLRPAGDGEAVAQMLQAMLVSPEVNFRLEAGPAGTSGPMDQFALASAISYGVSDSPPDKELMDLAASGGLQSQEAIAQQVKRLLGKNGGAGNLDLVIELWPLSPTERFFREYLHYDYTERVDKAAEFDFHRPDFLKQDTRRLLKNTLAETAGGGLFPALFGTKTFWVQWDTARNFGLSPKSGELANPVKMEMPDRAGVLTHPSWLSGFSQMDHNDPIRRGRYIRESMLCEALPELPIGTIPKLDIEKYPVLREALGAHRADPKCAACHHLMDPIGFAFEGYDHVGRSRSMEAGKPVDASWEIVGATEPGLMGVHQGPAELGERLAASPLVARCFVAHSFMYWMGREPQAGDGCTLEQATKSFQDSNGSYPELVASLLSSPSLSLRRNP